MITRLRSDNGGEYISQDLENILFKNKIRHEFCAPRSPHQNGTAERNWRTLFEMARGMIIESRLEKSFWAYAMMAAAHIQNRMFCQHIGDTPYHLLTGKKPSISKLHVFGSVCFAYIHNQKKLDPRCHKGLFVGYDKYSPSYLVFLPESNRVMKFGTVKFTEKFESEASSFDKFSTQVRAGPKTSFSTNFDNFSTFVTTPFHTLIHSYDQRCRRYTRT